MVRTEPLGVRVSPEIKAKLMEIAKAEDRALASLVERILREWIAEQLRRAEEAPGQAPQAPTDGGQRA